MKHKVYSVVSYMVTLVLVAVFVLGPYYTGTSIASDVDHSLGTGHLWVLGLLTWILALGVVSAAVAVGAAIWFIRLLLLGFVYDRTKGKKSKLAVEFNLYASQILGE